MMVLTAMPNYPRGKIFEGYGGFYKKEIINELSILRCFIYPTKNIGIIKRLANYFSFVFSSILIGLFCLPKVDILFSESPPLFIGISGFILSKIKRARWIFNVSDLWPGSAVELNILKNKFLIKLTYALESFCYNHAQLVTGQSYEILQSVNSRFPDVNTHHLSNGVDTSKFFPESFSNDIHNQLVGNYTCVFLYAGLHGIAQGLDQILVAVSKITTPEFCIVFVGDGPVKEDLLYKTKELNLINVKFWDPVPANEMPALVASADVAIVPLKKHLFGAVPSKLYESMASGVPVIIVDDGEGAKIVSQNNCGIVVDPGDIESLSKAFIYLSENKDIRHQYGKSGRKIAVQSFDRKEIVRRFLMQIEKFGCKS